MGCSSSTQKTLTSKHAASPAPPLSVGPAIPNNPIKIDREGATLSSHALDKIEDEVNEIIHEAIRDHDITTPEEEAIDSIVETVKQGKTERDIAKVRHLTSCSASAHMPLYSQAVEALKKVEEEIYVKKYVEEIRRSPRREFEPADFQVKSDDIIVEFDEREGYERKQSSLSDDMLCEVENKVDDIIQKARADHKITPDETRLIKRIVDDIEDPEKTTWEVADDVTALENLEKKLSRHHIPVQ